MPYASSGFVIWGLLRLKLTLHYLATVHIVVSVATGTIVNIFAEGEGASGGVRQGTEGTYKRSVVVRQH